ncbi:MAG: hypothetical protein ACREJ3_06320 [Polyangiaceae bacterium]
MDPETEPPRAEEARTPNAPADVVAAALAADPTPDRARATRPQEDPRLLIHAVAEEMLAPVYRAILDLKQRIEELERRPPPAPSPAQVSPPPSYAQAHGQPKIQQHIEPQPRVFSAPASVIAPAGVAHSPGDFDITVELDGALDGRRRKRRLALTFVLLLVMASGAMIAALVRSYQPH